MDFLGNISGIKDLLLLLCFYIYGGYADFYKYFQQIKSSFTFSSSGKPIDIDIGHK